MNNIEKLYLETNSPAEYTKSYFSYLNSVFEAIDFESVSKIINLIIDTGRNRSCIYIFGNGGSAATATHLANDLNVGVNNCCHRLNVRGLVENTSVLTAIANDFSYEDIFKKQIESCLNPEDLILAYSVSGNSENVIKAVEHANSRGVTTVSFTGFSGGRLKNISKYNVHIPSEEGEYGPVEDAHLTCNHIISNYLMGYYKSEK